MAGAAIGTAIGGPVGGVAGTVVGGVIGAYGGRSVAEAVNPTEEEQYWRENHPRQPYASSDFGYEHYAPAYRIIDFQQCGADDLIGLDPVPVI